MTSSTDQPDDLETKLRALIARGFQFVHPRDADGELVAVIGVRAHHGVIDVVQLHAEHDTTAIRIPGTEPDILAPATVLWRRAGHACHVLDEVLALDDRRPGAAHHSGEVPTGCWVPGLPGRPRWLAATG